LFKILDAYIEPAHHHQARIKTLTKTLVALYGQRAKKNAEVGRLYLNVFLEFQMLSSKL
jgi:hypothetical protein